MESTLTISDIVAHPGIDTHIVSGHGGRHRNVFWAHSCEKSDPARWLGPHELLMTIGLCIPSGRHAQKNFIAELDNAGLAGIAIGDDDLAPHLTKAMFAESNARGFPILSTGKDTPFAVLGRTVAAANANRQTMDVLMLAKLYQVAGNRGKTEVRSGRPLSDLFRTVLTVVDEETGCVVIGKGVLPPSSQRVYRLRTTRPTSLHVDAEAELDNFSLAHLSQVLSVDANEIVQDALDRHRRSAAMLDRVLDGDLKRVDSLLTHLGTEPFAFRMLAFSTARRTQVAMALALSESSAAVSERGENAVAIIPATNLEDVRNALGKLEVRVGASDEHVELNDLQRAVTEARQEYLYAKDAGERWRVFEGQEVSLLARSVTEAREIVEMVLGPLCGEQARETLLRETLFCFLDLDQHWAQAASELSIHRQTLVYRLAQVEKITGRSVRRTKDLAEFWLARSAWDKYSV